MIPIPHFIGGPNLTNHIVNLESRRATKHSELEDWIAFDLEWIVNATISNSTCQISSNPESRYRDVYTNDGYHTID